MGKLRINSNYGVTPNALLNNQNISLKAKGLYGYIQSKSDGWDFSAEKISNQCKEGIDAIRVTLIELEKFGYLVREKYQNEKGHWDIDYVLYEIPMFENPILEIPIQGNPILENTQNITKKDSIKKEERKKENKDFDLSFVDIKYKDIVNSWLQYKKEKNQSYKSITSIKVMYENLLKFSKKDVAVAKGIIEKSILANYTGFFAPNSESEIKRYKEEYKDYLKEPEVEKIYFKWQNDGSSIEIRSVDKDKAEEFFANWANGGYYPVFYNKK
jgi:hypothetical protein